MTARKWKWPLVGTILLMVCLVCLLVLQSEESDTAPFYVEVTAAGQAEKIVPWKNDDGTYYVFFPGYADASTAAIRLETTGKVEINHQAVTDGQLCDAYQLDVLYDLVFSAWGGECHRQIVFVQSANVPTMFIDTESGSMEYIHAEKGNEEAGEMRLYLPDGTLSCAEEIADINGRGNNTWDAFEKKPYSVKLKNEQDLLGMGAAQKWILLANADDPSHMRNKIVFDFADEIGLEYSPDADWVDLYLNGEYVGLYLLSERNEIHPERVNVPQEESVLLSMERTDRIEKQQYQHIDTSQHGSVLRVHFPVELTHSEINELQEIWDEIEDAIINSGLENNTAWQEKIDVESWVKKYLVEEVFGNIDGGMNSQFFYLRKQEDQWKMYAGPVWDYDHSMGSGGTWQFSTREALLTNAIERGGGMETPWFYWLYQDGVFKKMLVDVYRNEMMEEIGRLLSQRIDSYLYSIQIASEMNQLRWNIEGSCKEEATEIQDYLAERNKFLYTVWVEGKEYYQIKADDRTGTFLGYFAVEGGTCMECLPTAPDNIYQSFLGWYYEGTDEPFDPTRPIYEDTAVYAKWEDTPYKKMERVKKLVPAAVLVMMFLAVLGVNLRRMRKGG